ncbi:MAG: hypothetical protein Kow00114_06690 [Kiloniellaceae bacterium]
MAQQPDKRDQEKYARESFSFRRMKGWQLWGVTAVAVVVLAVAISYGIA